MLLHALPAAGLTPVTAESFARWKEEKAKRKAAETEAKRLEEAKKTGTKGYSALSGRALFSYDPSLFIDDAAADDDVYSEHDGEEDEGQEGVANSGSSSGGVDADGNDVGAAGGAGVDSMSGLAAAIGDESLYMDGGDDDLDDLDDDEEEGNEDGGEGGEDDEEDGDR